MKHNAECNPEADESCRSGDSSGESPVLRVIFGDLRYIGIYCLDYSARWFEAESLELP
jgi:hypothetical protein